MVDERFLEEVGTVRWTTSIGGWRLATDQTARRGSLWRRARVSRRSNSPSLPALADRGHQVRNPARAIHVLGLGQHLVVTDLMRTNTRLQLNRTCARTLKELIYHKVAQRFSWSTRRSTSLRRLRLGHLRLGRLGSLRRLRPRHLRLGR